MGFMEDVADRVILTHAEQAVLAESAESARAELAVFAVCCQSGNTAGAIRQYPNVLQQIEYMSKIIGIKVQRAVNG